MKKILTLSAWKKDVLKDPVLKAEYEKLQPEINIIRAIIEARLNKGMTQKDLAEKMGTKQSVISRLESGRANPSILILRKLAHALQTELQIKFVTF